VNEKLWALRQPHSLHEAADDILHVDTQEMIRFLAKKAITDAAASRLEDFSDIIGG
jgi:hypothetical protein